jgi:ubiquinone/menaquinone biosynthesis C-methylase UbiE
MASFVPALARASLRGTRRALSRLARASPHPRSSTAASLSSAAADVSETASSSPLPPGSFGAAIARPWAEALVELSQPSATDATLDLATGTGTCAFAVADAIEEAKRWGPKTGAGALGGAPEGLVASVLGLDKDRHALKRANEALLDLRSRSEGVRVAFAWADACHADAPWHEEKKRAFARAYCAFGLNRFADPETACRRVRESLVPGGAFVASVWAPLEKKTQPLFYAAYLAVVETIDLMETKRAASETWLVAAKTAAFAHFTAPFDWVEPDSTDHPSGEDTNARAIDKLERLLIRAGFDAPDAATERAGHARFRNLEHAASACLGGTPFFKEMCASRNGVFRDAFLERFEALLLDAAGDDLQFVRSGSKDEDASLTVPLTAYFAHATAPWR